MTLTDGLSLFGGLALFLYGMHTMSDGLEVAAGEKMRQILQKLTSSTIMGVLVGTVITAITQSSSATTVMLVGFVNSGLMELDQTVGIIMGANIGATMNGVLLAVGIGDIAPIFAFIGVCLIMFSKDEKKNQLGTIIAGLGILFIGMNMMSSSMSALRSSPWFLKIMTSARNPLVGIIVGAIFTAIIQSSSASVGILQALAVSGMVTLDDGIYLMFGFTIGTCITAAIAAIGTGANAKRTTFIHFAFNVIGTVIFVIICQIFPFTRFVEHLFPNSPAAQVANAHVIFKVVTTLILLPFSKQLVRLSELVIKDKSAEGKRIGILERARTVAGYNVGTGAIAISLIKEEVDYMYDIAKENVAMSFDAMISCTDDYEEKISRNEDELDELNTNISTYISQSLHSRMSAHDADVVSGYFRIVGNIERIGDHAVNFADYTRYFLSKDVRLSDRAQGEVVEMKKKILSAMDILENQSLKTEELLAEVSRAEDSIDEMTENYRNAQMDRMKTTTCTPEASVVYSEMLTDFERMGDHLLNIAEEIAKMYPKDVATVGRAIPAGN